VTRILVVDDDAMVRTAIRAVLEDAGYEVLEAANGRSGLEVFDHSDPDIIVTDLLMPEMDGIETIIELKRRRCGAKILAISGEGGVRHPDLLGFARRLGADHALAKPFAPDGFLGAIRSLLASGPPAAAIAG